MMKLPRLFSLLPLSCTEPSFGESSRIKISINTDI